MDAARLQTVINKGYRIAAARIGPSFVHYRPATATSVIAPANIVTAALPASFASHNANQFSYDRPDNHRDVLNNGLFDADVVEVGDYLVGEPGTWYVASKEPIKPPLCVRCNRIVTSVARPGSGAECGTVGIGGYGGATVEGETVIMAGWPASMRTAVGLRTGFASLPQNYGAQGVEVLMPAYGAIEIRQGDAISDDLGRRFVVRTAEWTHLGWRIGAVEAVA